MKFLLFVLFFYFCLWRKEELSVFFFSHKINFRQEQKEKVRPLKCLRKVAKETKFFRFLFSCGVLQDDKKYKKSQRQLEFLFPTNLLSCFYKFSIKAYMAILYFVVECVFVIYLYDVIFSVKYISKSKKLF